MRGRNVIHHIQIAAQTVLFAHRLQLGINENQIIELSQKVAHYARLFQSAELEEMTKENVDTKGRLLMSRLSNEALLESIMFARRLKLEKEFIKFLSREVERREQEQTEVE